MTSEDLLRADYQRLMEAIQAHHDQHADDRCWMDDQRLYAAAGLEPADLRVGNKAEMLLNCARFVNRRCEEGHWPSYADLEAEIGRLHQTIDKVAAQLEGMADAEVEGSLPSGAVCRWLAGLLRSARTNGPKPGE